MIQEYHLQSGLQSPPTLAYLGHDGKHQVVHGKDHALGEEAVAGVIQANPDAD